MQAHPGAVGLLAAHRRPQSAKRRKADGVGFGEADEDFGEVFGATDGAGADERLRRHRDVHQRPLAEPAARSRTSRRLLRRRPISGGTRLLAQRPPASPAPAASRSLEGVVGPGGQRQQGDVADLGGHCLVRAVAAEHGDQRHAALDHAPRRQAGILDALAQRHVEELQERPVAVAGLAGLAGPEHGGGDAGHVRRQQRMADAGGAEGGEQALHHRCLVGAGVQPGMGGEATQVATGGRVGDDADDRRGRGHSENPPSTAMAWPVTCGAQAR